MNQKQYKCVVCHTPIEAGEKFRELHPDLGVPYYEPYVFSPMNPSNFDRGDTLVHEIKCLPKYTQKTGVHTPKNRIETATLLLEKQPPQFIEAMKDLGILSLFPLLNQTNPIDPSDETAP